MKNNLKKTFKNCICLFLTVCVMLTVVLTDGSTARADKYDEQQAQTQMEIDSLSGQKALAQAAVNSLKAQADEQSSTYADYSSKLSTITAEIDEINSSIQNVTEQIAELSAEMTKIRKLQQQQYEDMQARIQYSYEEGSSSVWITLLTSNSFAQFLNRAEYYAQIAAYDAKIISDYEDTVEKINQKSKELESKQNELDSYQLTLDEKKGELEQLTTDARTALTGTEEQIDDAEDSVEEYDKQLEELNVKMMALQWQQAQAQAELARQIALEEAAEEAARQAEAVISGDGTAEGGTAADGTAEGGTTGDGTGGGAEGTEGTEGTGESGGGTDISTGDGGAAVVPTVSEYREYTGGAVPCTAEEVYLLAATIQAEADNQSYEGKLAVASVICNRVMSSKFPSTVSGVISQSGQFASYSSGKVQLIYEHGPNETCLQAASQCLSGTRTGDWLFFMTKQYADYYGITGYTVIGDHVFFYRWGAN